MHTLWRTRGGDRDGNTQVGAYRQRNIRVLDILRNAFECG